jgi:hypothetical protein
MQRPGTLFSLNVTQYSPNDQWRRGGMMKKASFADVKARFSAFLNESQEEPLVVMRHGKSTAVLKGVHDEDQLDLWFCLLTPPPRHPRSGPKGSPRTSCNSRRRILESVTPNGPLFKEHGSP